jgi:hypothetical protein
MIKFFRKIRQRLLTENKFSKYVLYAFGEIILVVIGILIALKVNNWNEERKLDNNVATVLIKLKQDLIADIYYLEDMDSTYRNWDIQANIILNALHGESIKQITDMSEYQVGRGSMNNLSIRTTTFDQLKNSGLLYHIQEPSITQEINFYYEFAKIEIEKSNLDNQEFYRYVLNTSGQEYVSTLSRLFYKKNLEYMDWSWLQDPKSTQYQIFEGRISFHKEAIRVDRILIAQLIEKANNILQVIDQNYPGNI